MGWWSFVDLSTDEAQQALGISSIEAQVPKQWILPGTTHSLHSTVLLRLNQALAQQFIPLIRQHHVFDVEIQSLAVGEVPRWNCHAIAVGLRSEHLRALKQSFLDTQPQQMWKEFCPYDSDGHITVAYVKSEVQEEARRFCEQHAEKLQGRKFTVQEVVVQLTEGAAATRKVVKTEVVKLLPSPPSAAM
eukprot:TRINITY_DN128_c0_g6_i1.p1 TRINITY_DN128_c0_g6~~TRINITY_DN128_c0_g6_i1.p1  ORF type:complete len:189 (-),score=35.88 TRINITY_DN128_c0_g6_i1:57-623(-)